MRTASPMTVIHRVAAVVLALTMLLLVFPRSARADSSGPTPYHGVSGVQCFGNSQFHYGDDSSLAIFPNYDQTDSRNFDVYGRFHIIRWNGRQWVAAEEYDGSWPTGRTVSPTGWIRLWSTSASTVRVAGDGGGQRVYFDLAPGYYHVYTQLAFRRPGGSWEYSGWMSSASYYNVTYRQSIGASASYTTQSYCDTTSRTETVSLGYQ